MHARICPAFSVAVFLGTLILAGAGCRSEPLTDPLAFEAADVFPIKPGTQEWANLRSHTEMVEVTQLSEESLRSMSTEQLFATCLDYPLLGDMLAYNSPQQGFDAVVQQFGGLRELLKRPDVGSVALSKYTELDARSVIDHPGPEVPAFVFKLILLETLLAQPPITASMSDEELHQFAVEARRKLQTKLDGVDAGVYGAPSIEASALIVARVLDRLALPAFKNELGRSSRLSGFLRTGTGLDDEALSTILTGGVQEISQ